MIDWLTTGGLAWDWVNQKLYWTDLCDDDIEVYDPTTQVRRVLFDVDITEPWAIVVDPTTGYVCYSLSRYTWLGSVRPFPSFLVAGSLYLGQWQSQVNITSYLFLYTCIAKYLIHSFTQGAALQLASKLSVNYVMFMIVGCIGRMFQETGLREQHWMGTPGQCYTVVDWV